MTVKQLWNKACEFDGIDPESKFVVFSKANPWVPAYNRAVMYATKFMRCW